MYPEKHLTRTNLAGKVIDAHAHIGVTLKGYARLEFPYAQTLEGLYYRQRAGGVDVNVVFPFTPDLFSDPYALARGQVVPAATPLSPSPYAVENEMVMSEVFRFCPEHRERFIPFVSVDPGRAVEPQLGALLVLERQYPIYGIKVSPVLCQSKAIELLGGGRPLIEFARERGLPLLFHTTADARETFSQPSDIFRIIEQYPDLRFCLAHCIGFNRAFLDRADAAPNVWVDTSALKIQVQLAFENSPIMAPPAARFEADYSDHTEVMRALCRQYPKTMIWGTDAPAYSYICQRRQAEGVVQEFRLKATYEDEKAALDALPPDLRRNASNTNTLNWLFGEIHSEETDP